MSLRIYNTLTRQKELFEPVTPGQVRMYVCGMTVYKPPHIGHMVGPVVFDAIKRYLTYKGFKVTWVVNITDVDDKLIEKAHELGANVEALAEKNTAEYFAALKAYGVDGIDQFPRASQYMAEIIKLCQDLIDRGFAYPADGNVWFDVSKDHDYGKLSHRRVEEQEAGTRTLEGAGKRNTADFALWKSAKPGEPAWDSPWGRGRPGWHIECSAMSMKLLGKTFDLHGGGMDLMFPHHENELAQSESATGQTFANFWMHHGLTRIRTKMRGGEWADEKMSGSIGNVVPARELVEKHGAEVMRYFLISTHYRRPIEFTDEALANAHKGYAVFARLFERIARLNGAPLADDALDFEQQVMGRVDSPSPGTPGEGRGEGPSANPKFEVRNSNQIQNPKSNLPNALTPHPLPEYQERGQDQPQKLSRADGELVEKVAGLKSRFMEMMDDDFNTAGAIAVMHDLAGEINAFIERSNLEKEKNPEHLKAAIAAAASLRNLGKILGLFRFPAIVAADSQDHGTLDGVMKLLIQLRNESRKKKDFTTADTIRDGLKNLGIVLEDRANETFWRKQ